jgi:hypothetical protein
MVFFWSLEVGRRRRNEQEENRKDVQAPEFTLELPSFPSVLLRLWS